jgi:ATP-dependent Lhr-like helicase
VVVVHAAGGPFWAAVERLPTIAALYPEATAEPARTCPVPAPPPEEEAAAADVLRGHLECRGPSTIAELAETVGLGHGLIIRALAALEAEGFALQGHFTSHDQEAAQWCSRRLLSRIHVYTRDRRRREIEPVTARDFMRFLLRWQHVAEDARREGRLGVLAVVEQLQGFEVATGAWERSVLAARVQDYRPEWLDELCMAGQVAWGRLSVRDTEPDAAPKRAGAPSKATPITLVLRDDLPWLLRAARGDQRPAEPAVGRTADVLEALGENGALFRTDLTRLTGRLPDDIDDALWDAVARGLVTADGFRAVRSLLRRRTPDSRYAPTRGLRRGLRNTTGSSGRWSLLPAPAAEADRDELAEAIGEQLVARWGVVFRDLAVRENLAVPWRDIIWALRRMEARGTIRGGRFVSGFSGEQYAHPDALDVLRAVRKPHQAGERVSISAADPLNLTGIILPGPRITAIAANTVTFIDGATTDPIPA